MVALRPIVDHIIKRTRGGKRNNIARLAVIRLDTWEEVDIGFFLKIDKIKSKSNDLLKNSLDFGGNDRSFPIKKYKAIFLTK